MTKELLLFAKAISEPKRLAILKALQKECCVGQLWKRLGLSQNLTSHHLKVLKEAKLIEAERRGLKIVYKIKQANLEKNLKTLQVYLSE